MVVGNQNKSKASKRSITGFLIALVTGVASLAAPAAAEGEINASLESIDWAGLGSIFDGIATLAPHIVIMVVGFIALIILMVVIGFVTGILDGLLGGITSSMNVFHRR